jgi:hypothetical protein
VITPVVLPWGRTHGRTDQPTRQLAYSALRASQAQRVSRDWVPSSSYLGAIRQIDLPPLLTGVVLYRMEVVGLRPSMTGPYQK